jgi:hypothetical protein
MHRHHPGVDLLACAVAATVFWALLIASSLGYGRLADRPVVVWASTSDARVRERIMLARAAGLTPTMILPHVGMK